MFFLFFYFYLQQACYWSLFSMYPGYSGSVNKKKKNTFKGLNLNIITDMNVLSTKTITDKDNGIALHPWLILRPIWVELKRYYSDT